MAISFDTSLASCDLSIHPSLIDGISFNFGPCNEKLATFARLRPLNNFNLKDSPYSIVGNSLYLDETFTIGSNGPRRDPRIKKKVYNFTDILDNFTSQISVFNKCCAPLIVDVLNGTSSLVFCYGTTSSGKSFTMRGPHGDPSSDPGLIPLTLVDIFSTRTFLNQPFARKVKFCDVEELSQQEIVSMIKVQQSNSFTTSFSDFVNINQSYNQIQSDDDIGEYNCYLSYFELYDDNIYDLLTTPLNGSRGSSLSMAQDEKQRYYIKGLKSVMVSNLKHALETYSFGWRNLQKNIHETGLNANSSRSHSFFTISLIKRKDGLIQISHLTLGDLAGSERQNKTHSQGTRMKEGASINKSLMNLNMVFKQVRQNQKNPNKNIIQFRNSNLTKFFQPYVTGTGKVWMILNINPSPELLPETKGTLEFSSNASDIVTNTVFSTPICSARKRPLQQSFSQMTKICRIDETCIIDDSCYTEKSLNPIPGGSSNPPNDQYQVPVTNSDLQKTLLEVKQGFIAELENKLVEIKKSFHDDHLSLVKELEEQSFIIKRMEQQIADLTAAQLESQLLNAERMKENITKNETTKKKSRPRKKKESTDPDWSPRVFQPVHFFKTENPFFCAQKERENYTPYIPKHAKTVKYDSPFTVGQSPFKRKLRSRRTANHLFNESLNT